VIEAELDSWFTPALSPTETTTLLELLARLRSAQRPALDSKAAGQ
jgi:hypothetical protein